MGEGVQSTDRRNKKGGESMKRVIGMTGVRLLVSALMLAFACAAGNAEENGGSALPVTKPFKANWAGNMHIVGFCADGSLMVVNLAKGSATHMGASGEAASICLDPVTGLGSGNAVTTAANGDAVYYTISLQSIGLGGPSGTWQETEIVTGGTGRFLNASGTVTSSGAWVATSATSFSWVGTSEGTLAY